MLYLKEQDSQTLDFAHKARAIIGILHHHHHSFGRNICLLFSSEGLLWVVEGFKTALVQGHKDRFN